MYKQDIYHPIYNFQSFPSTKGHIFLLQGFFFFFPFSPLCRYIKLSFLALLGTLLFRRNNIVIVIHYPVSYGLLRLSIIPFLPLRYFLSSILQLWWWTMSILLCSCVGRTSTRNIRLKKRQIGTLIWKLWKTMFNNIVWSDVRFKLSL